MPKRGRSEEREPRIGDRVLKNRGALPGSQRVVCWITCKGKTRLMTVSRTSGRPRVYTLAPVEVK